MKLIIDGGATRIKAAIINNDQAIQLFDSEGINLNIDKEESLIQKMNQWPINRTGLFDEIHFYLAGYSNIHEKKIYSAIIKSQIFSSQYFFYSDLLAAARGTFGAKKGIICILGTGSNSGYFDGAEIAQKVSSLGYLLADEGSGFSIGKSILKHYFRNELPIELQDSLKKFLTDELYLSHLSQIYALPYPHILIAQVCKWAGKFQNHKKIQSLIKSEFKNFYLQNLENYLDLSENIAFVGSIAYHFDEILRKSIPETSFKICHITKDPLEGLIKFHQH